MKNLAVILAGGTGSRMNSKIPKQFIKINQKEMLAYSLKTFSSLKDIDGIILVSNKDYFNKCQDLILKYKIKKLLSIVAGGENRQCSVKNGIEEAAKFVDEANVLVHDSARPFVSKEIIQKHIEALKTYECTTTAISSVDSTYQVKNGFVEKCLDRETIYIAQTPQCARLSLFTKAFKKASKLYTDEVGLLSCINKKPFVIEGNSDNFKITFSKDLDKYKK